MAILDSTIRASWRTSFGRRRSRISGQEAKFGVLSVFFAQNSHYFVGISLLFWRDIRNRLVREKPGWAATRAKWLEIYEISL